MKKTISPTIDVRAARRVICVMLCALLIVATAPVLFAPKASAAQLSSRSIQLSDSAPSGGSIVSGVGSGTSVAYQVTFTVTNEAASLVIDFCSNDPIISDTCTAPTGMDASAAVLNATAFNGTVQTTTDNWAVTASASQIKLANDNVGGAGGTHPTHDIQAAATESFQLTGITNPSGNPASFYGRIYTYPENSWCALGQTSGATCYSSATSLGTAMTDYGGVALSTVAVIQITARVQESLTFCVTAADPNTWTGSLTTQGTCASGAVLAAPPVITLGHSVGGGTPVLTPQAIDTTPVWSQLSTNSTNGAIVNLRTANTTCTYTGMPVGFPGGGLSADGGTTCNIPPIADGANTGASAMTAGTAAFGVNVCNYTATGQVTSNVPANQSGNLDPTAEYDSGAGNCPHTSYGMDTTTNTGSAPFPGSNGNVSTTYGSTIANAHISGVTPGPIFAADDEDTFAATASLTTPAGIYTANLVMIATGTF